MSKKTTDENLIDLLVTSYERGMSDFAQVMNSGLDVISDQEMLFSIEDIKNFIDITVSATGNETREEMVEHREEFLKLVVDNDRD